MHISKKQRVLLIILGTITILVSGPAPCYLLPVYLLPAGACFFLAISPRNSKKRAWEMFNDNKRLYCKKILHAMKDHKEINELKKIFEFDGFKNQSDVIKATRIVARNNKIFKFIFRHLGDLSEFDKILRNCVLEILDEWIKEANNNSQRSLLIDK